MGVGNGIIYIAMTGDSTTTVLKRIQTSNLSNSLSDAAFATQNDASDISQIFLLPDGLAVFSNSASLLSRFRFAADGSTSLVGTMKVQDGFQQVLQDQVNPYIFTRSLVYQSTPSRASANNLVYQTMDFTNSPTLVGDAITIENTQLSWVRGTNGNNFVTDGAFTIGLCNGVVYWTYFVNDVYTSVRNYIVSSKSYNVRSATETASPATTISPTTTSTATTTSQPTTTAAVSGTTTTSQPTTTSSSTTTVAAGATTTNSPTTTSSATTTSQPTTTAAGTTANSPATTTSSGNNVVPTTTTSTPSDSQSIRDAASDATSLFTVASMSIAIMATAYML
ncbi:hypothetical protein AKO1_012585 [Acrasis kona]|uniref:Uncharacterized protein n=1 Tax=Acrasis kona TaxID=1008807 RepID=A0AAW2YVQ9_9EUKA